METSAKKGIFEDFKGVSVNGWSNILDYCTSV